MLTRERNQMSNIKKMVVMAMIIVTTIVTAFVMSYIDSGTVIARSSFEETRPEGSNSSELVIAYREASREAVEDYFGESVTDDYIYCYTAPSGGGMFYYCIVSETAYRFWVNAGSSEDVYSYIVYGNPVQAPGMDEFDFVLSDNNLFGLLFPIFIKKIYFLKFKY